MKLLLETGVQEDIECKFCGYESAMEEGESRYDLTPDNFKYDGGYGIQRICPICGWTEYEDYSPTEEEEDDWPDDLYDPHVEYEPNKQQAVIAGKIVNIMDKAIDVDEEGEQEVYEAMVEYIWARHNPEDPKIHNVQAFKAGVIDYIFSERG